jgi:hypothetical protein
MGKSIVVGLIIGVSVIIGACIIAHTISLNGRYVLFESTQQGIICLDTRTGDMRAHAAMPCAWME